MARQASDDDLQAGAYGWQAMTGSYAAADGCEYQAIALAILHRCGATAAPAAPAARDAPTPRIAERDRR